MELYQLEYFRILCKYGNFTNASEELMVTQPAVSMAVKKLEEEYCVELIDRDNKDGKAFALTRMGELVLKHAIAIHNEVSAMRTELEASFLKKREVVRFAVPFTMCPSRLMELLAAYMVQNQTITLHLLQKGHAAAAKGLADRSIDIGVFNKDIVNPLLAQRDYTRVQIYASFSADHPFNGHDRITPDMLQGETVIFSKISSKAPGYVRRYLEENKIEINELFHDGFPDGDVRLAQLGRGVALAPKHIAGPGSVPLDPPLYCDLVMAWNSKNGLTKEQSDLIDFLFENELHTEE